MFSRSFTNKFVSRGNGFSSKRYQMLFGLRALAFMLITRLILFGYLVLSLNKVEDALKALSEFGYLYPPEAWYVITILALGTAVANAYQNVKSNGYTKSSNSTEQVRPSENEDLS